MKICKKCNIKKDLIDFKKAKQNKDGRTNTCKTCIEIKEKEYRLKNKEKKKQYDKAYVGANKEIISIKRTNYYNKNKQKIKEYYDKWQENNKEHLLEYRAEYYSKNKKRISDYKKANRPKLNKYRNELLKTNINFLLSERLRSRVNKALKTRKSAATYELLGCSIDFFKEYIESKFTKGMNWENYGQNGWHIDHIKPCASFNLSSIAEQKKCFHYTNLQPLWATSSIAKAHGELDNYIGNLEKGAKP